VAALLRAAARSLPPSAVLSLKELPWLRQLDAENRSLFVEEYAATYAAALENGDWQPLDDLVGEWQATAEALGDEGLRELLAHDALPSSERVPLPYPE